jgi:signal transduction histidine kinase
LLLVGVVLLVGSGIFLARVAEPSDATVVILSEREPGTTLRLSDVLDADSGLRSGDVVVALDGVPVARGARLSERHLGDVLTYGILRDGVAMDIPVTLGRWPGERWALRNWPVIAFAVSILVLGVQVFRRRPTDPAARALLAIGALGAVGFLAFLLGGQAVDLVDGRDLPWLAAGELCLAGMWTCWATLILIFPEPLGRIRVSRWTTSCMVALVVTYVGYLLVEIPRSSTVVVAQWRALAVSLAPGYLVPPFLLLGVIAQLWVTRGTPAQRYVGWVLGAFALCSVLYYVIWQVPSAVRGAPLVNWMFVPFAAMPSSLTMAAVVLRFGLFDVKAVAGRSLVYMLLTVGVAAGYTAIVVGLGALVTTGSLLAPSLLATVILALLVQPVKDRLQRAVSRMLYGSRDEPYTALSRLGHQLECAGTAEAVLPTVAGAVAAALRMPYAAVELCAADGSVLRCAEVGSSRSATSVTLPAVAGGELVGRLLVTPRHPAKHLADSELRLLTDLARQSAPALQALQLTVELQRSRGRLLRARAEERRRIQRDLHDGIGPSLAGLTMQIGAARASLDSGAVVAASSALAEIERQLTECATDLRQLLMALWFPLLDSLGLVGALRYQATRLSLGEGPDITVTAPPDLSALPAAVEEAALAIASEAMTNAAKHAWARHCDVSITISDVLQLGVVDDGRGIAEGAPTGIGLHSMRKRVADLGGSIRIGRIPTGGTEVWVSLPLTSP